MALEPLRVAAAVAEAAALARRLGAVGTDIDLLAALRARVGTVGLAAAGDLVRLAEAVRQGFATRVGLGPPEWPRWGVRGGRLPPLSVGPLSAVRPAGTHDLVYADGSRVDGRPVRRSGLFRRGGLWAKPPGDAGGPGGLTPQMVDENWLRLMLDRSLVPAELKARLAMSAAERLEAAVPVDLRVGAGSHLRAPTSPFRHATLWHWLRERSPLQGRRDLVIYGAGMGAAPVMGPGGWQLALTEPIELASIFSSEGAGLTSYVELDHDLVTDAFGVIQSGRMLTYPTGRIPLIRLITREGVDDSDATIAYLDDVIWAIEELKRAGVVIENDSELVFSTGSTGPTGTPSMLSHLRVEEGDLVTHPLPRGTADFVSLLYTLPYVAEFPLRAMALVRWAAVPRPGGLIAVTLDTQNRFESRVFSALGYRVAHTVSDAPDPSGRMVHAVYQRPTEPVPLLDELTAAIDLILAGN